MALRHQDLAPYLSASVFKSAENISVESIRTGIKALLQNNPAHSSTKKTVKNLPDINHSNDDVNIACIHYLEQRVPAWFKGGSEILDKYNHLVVIVARLRTCLICFTDNALRDRVMARISAEAQDDAFSSLKRLLPREINTAFVSNEEIKTLWLNGIHRRSAVRPDAKVLAGSNLESALNPLSDQSFYFSSIRSASKNIEFDNIKPVIGASSRNSRIWIGPTGDWTTFVKRSRMLLEQVNLAITNEISTYQPPPVLAQSKLDIGNVADAYDMALVPPELLDTDYNSSDASKALAQRWAYEGKFEITNNKSNADFDVVVTLAGSRIGKLHYAFEVRNNDEIKMQVSTVESDWDDDHPDAEEALKICSRKDWVTVYYDSGDAFSRGQFYQMQFRDMPFDDWEWVNMNGFDVSKEKPMDDGKFVIDNIGKDDDSLFTLVAKRWPGLTPDSTAQGWLICDDGAMESADFIHLNEQPPCLSLIHVKGSKSKKDERSVSVADYEVVVGQAVKNIRHLDADLLAEKLNSNAGNKIATAIWHNGIKQDNRAAFIEKLKTISANYNRKVYVLQPRVRKGSFDALNQLGEQVTAEKKRMRQLDSLLFGAKLDCMAVGAEFYVIGEDDSAAA